MECSRCGVDEAVMYLVDNQKVICHACKEGKFRCHKCKDTFISKAAGIVSSSHLGVFWICWDCMIGKNTNRAHRESWEMSKEEEPEVFQVCTVTFEEIMDDEL